MPGVPRWWEASGIPALHRIVSRGAGRVESSAAISWEARNARNVHPQGRASGQGDLWGDKVRFQDLEAISRRPRW